MSCTRRVAKLLSQATPFIEYAEEKLTENISAATTAIIAKSAATLTKENAQKTYASIQNLFSSCRRKKINLKVNIDPELEIPNNLKKRF